MRRIRIYLFLLLTVCVLGGAVIFYLIIESTRPHPAAAEADGKANDCDMENAYRRYGRTLQRLAAAKAMCGWLVRNNDVQQFVVCTGALPSPALSHTPPPCESVELQNAELALWLDTFIPSARAACLDDRAMCASFLLTNQSRDLDL